MLKCTHTHIHTGKWCFRKVTLILIITWTHRIILLMNHIFFSSWVRQCQNPSRGKEGSPLHYWRSSGQYDATALETTVSLCWARPYQTLYIKLHIHCWQVPSRKADLYLSGVTQQMWVVRCHSFGGKKLHIKGSESATSSKLLLWAILPAGCLLLQTCPHSAPDPDITNKIKASVLETVAPSGLQDTDQGSCVQTEAAGSSLIGALWPDC